MATVLKLSVLVDGTVLLNGSPIMLTDLAQELSAHPKEDLVVWYYRENAGAAAPPVAAEVMKLIVDRSLRMRLSSKPDFSDTFTPEVASRLAEAFTAIRQRAAQRQLVILRSDGRSVTLPALARDAADPQAVAAVERLLPSSTRQNVAVIAETAWTMADKPGLRDAGNAIPFFGLLMGLATIGHCVWIFDGGNVALLAAGCRDADLVIVDGAQLEKLPAGWRSLVTPAMRTPFQLRQV
jgi:hypothetical protein